MQFWKREWKMHDEFEIKTQDVVTEEFMLHMCRNPKNTPKIIEKSAAGLF